MSADFTPFGIMLGLVGGIGATILGEVLRLRRKPRLSLELVEGLGPGRVARAEGAYARLEVRNASHRDGASGVSVRIEKVRGGTPKDAEKLSFLESWQLAWAKEDRGNPNVPPQPNPVSAGGSRQIDLAHLNSEVPGRLIVDIRPQTAPGSHMNYLGAGTFTFELVLSGENASARRFSVDVIHDGASWDGKHATAEDRLRLKHLRRL